MSKTERKFCVAPMMDWTDRHCRFFLRLMSRRAWLYTEMVTTGAIIHGDRERFLRFAPAEHPVALQLGGSEPEDLARCAEIGTSYGYDEINLNCGCPSDRVQEGRFGACLMKEPERVAAAVAAMRRATHLPVTVKTRIGVDESEDYVFLKDFIETVAAAGCEIFIVHARKAWLKGLSPKENREIPPLQYELVHRLKREFPQLTIVLNGGLKTMDACVEQIQELDGVMLGREVYENPYFMTEVDSRLYGAEPVNLGRTEVAEALLDYVERELATGAHLNHISRHILGLFRGQPGGRAFRRVISQNATRPGAGADVIRAALAEVEAASLRPAA
ncbi:tRNA dihydrouridine(20/20a) synthase DusA [Solimonas sp. K1W22B-7]|uniref:tRNA dihydrouridine(20/20a) synthase DusA n=1 Tax=Solimonas sp. K1W22B-7 TaxID=2303331 RepID=UPI000E33397B|nr:tRNA dihydrouridine(20/20a) synthase DusA [Solimonas sp. K1W22B-7]AXQ29329.1 tRNA dihydrouridine(20/20a) synthase DusA [Solimonas sp. K1W22B-7]